MEKKKENVIILGAAGRDFHDFNVYWKKRKDVNVVCFTAKQIPHIAGRTYPKELAGDNYPDGIPIVDESELDDLITKHKVTLCALAYSDLSYNYVMSLGSRANVMGANYIMLSPQQTMLKSNKPVISVCAVRTGCGKSQTSRYIVKLLHEFGKKVVVVRHPMPYGNLLKQRCQRYSSVSDLDKFECTIEEREEYEQHILQGTVLYAGVDYEMILREAEKECDIILWDGGNNDTSFYVPDFAIVVTDPLRAGHEKTYYPSEVNVRLADVILVNKVNSAKEEDVKKS
jgi:predicted GTPase